MISHNGYRKVATLRNGEKISIRFLNGRDRESLTKLFQESPDEEVEFCQEDLKNPHVVEDWLNLENSRRMMPLVAVEMKNQPVAALTLYRGEQAALKVGQIKTLFVFRAYQGLGVGSLILDEILELSLQDSLLWLKAEVPMKQKHVIKAFLARDFEIKATLEDFFISKKGVLHDVALMMRPLVKKDDDF
jgi:L-amino acid N-acyltransferase YncA